MAPRRRHDGAFKTQVVVEAMGSQRTVNEIAGSYGVHPSQVAKWKAEALKGLSALFTDHGSQTLASCVLPNHYHTLIEEHGHCLFE